jgi:hypothetical protein
MPGTVIFPSSPLNERAIDEEFEAEYAALQFGEVGRALVDQDRLMREREATFRRLPETGQVAYRGWMLDEAGYRALHEALLARDLRPVTSPEQYLAAHHLPGWVEIFKGLTPRTAFVAPDASRAEIITAAEGLHAEGFVIKDYVKSRKHEWDAACYAPVVEVLPDVVANFVSLQGEFLVGQVAIREYVHLDKAQPEYRVWWAHGEPIITTLHPDSADMAAEHGVSPAFLQQLKERVHELGAPFITTDVATLIDGEETLIEVGDGQVSGLPAGFNEAAYQALIEAVFGHIA